LITGGSQGIGAEIAFRFADEGQLFLLRILMKMRDENSICN